MPRNPENKRIEVLVSPAQHQVLVRLADEYKLSMADLARQALLKQFPQLPDDFAARGRYYRKT